MCRWLALAALAALAACSNVPDDFVVLLPEPDGSVGRVTITTASGEVETLDQPQQAAQLAARAKPVFEVEQEQVRSIFGKAFAVEPDPPLNFLLYFNSETTTLTEESAEQLPEILEAIDSRRVPDLSVVGHTDTAGDEAYNNDLARRRADAIRDEIVRLGVDPALVEVTSFGEADPLIPTPDGVHQRRNRRVEITIR